MLLFNLIFSFVECIIDNYIGGFGMNELTNNEKILVGRIQSALVDAKVHNSDYHLCDGTDSIGVCLNKVDDQWLVSTTENNDTKQFRFSNLKEAIPFLIKKVAKFDDAARNVLMDILFGQAESLTEEELQKIMKLNKLLKEHRIMDSNYSICEGNINEAEYEGCYFLNKENANWLTYKVEDGNRSSIKKFDQIDDAIADFIYNVTLNWRENIRTKFNSTSDYLQYYSGQTPDENTGKKIFVNMFVFGKENAPLTKEEESLIKRLDENLELCNISSDYYSLLGNNDTFIKICLNKHNNKWYIYYLDREGNINHTYGVYESVEEAIKNYLYTFLGKNDLTDEILSSTLEQKPAKIIKLEPKEEQ